MVLLRSTCKWLVVLTPERQGVQITLPRISFEIKGLNYDASRKLVPTQFAKTLPKRVTKENTPLQYSQYVPVPYNLQVELNIIPRTRMMALLWNRFCLTSIPLSMSLSRLLKRPTRNVTSPSNWIVLVTPTTMKVTSSTSYPDVDS